MDDFEIFTDLDTPPYPSGPFLTVSKNRSTVYFDKVSSTLIRQRGFTHVQFAVHRRKPVAVVQFVKPGAPGAMKLSNVASDRGSGTFQVGRAAKFFKNHGVKLGMKIHYPLSWVESLEGYEFDMPELNERAVELSGENGR